MSSSVVFKYATTLIRSSEMVRNVHSFHTVDFLVSIGGLGVDVGHIEVYIGPNNIHVCYEWFSYE